MSKLPFWLGLCATVWLGGTPVAMAQVSPRLTPSLAERQLARAQVALTAWNASRRQAGIAHAQKALALLDKELREVAGGQVMRPVERLGSRQKMLVYHAQAAARLTEAFVQAQKGCSRDELEQITHAYIVSLDALQSVGGNGTVAAVKRLTGLGKGGSLAVISGMRDNRHRPVFAVAQGSTPGHLFITGANLSDPQCNDPIVEALDLKGRPLATQPTIVGASPAAIEIQWTQAGSLSPGLYLIKVVPKKRHFLTGCSSRAPTHVAFAVTPAPTYKVTYMVSAECADSADGTSATHSRLLGKGTFPALHEAGKSTHVRIDTSTCAYPVSYSISAAVDSGAGVPRAMSPVSQSAGAQITAGLPGGLLLSWMPSMEQLTLTRGLQQCSGTVAASRTAAGPDDATGGGG